MFNVKNDAESFYKDMGKNGAKKVRDCLAREVKEAKEQGEDLRLEDVSKDALEEAKVRSAIGSEGVNSGILVNSDKDGKTQPNQPNHDDEER